MTPRLDAPLALTWVALIDWLLQPLTATDLLVMAGGLIVGQLALDWLRRRRVHQIDIPGGTIEVSGCSHAQAQALADALGGARKRGDL